MNQNNNQVQLRSKRIPIVPILVLLWLIGIVIRIFVLLTTERYIDPGEAVVGLMARDILHGKSFPFILIALAALFLSIASADQDHAIARTFLKLSLSCTW